MDRPMPTIHYRETPAVLLLGNGINRAFHFSSWDELIQTIQTKELSSTEKTALDTMPYPLRPIVLTEDHLGTKMKEIAPAWTALRAPEEEEKMLRSLADLPFDAVLTTNYTYELEKAIHPNFRCAVGRASKWRRITCKDSGKTAVKQLYSYFPGSSDSQSIWHIHGEAARPHSMVLGHYFYGKLLSAMQSYIPVLQRRFHGNDSRQQDMACRSWVDYFMLGDVYIVGQGLDLSELDLWWLINCKRRHFPETRVILYKPDLSDEQRLLAEAYHVELHTDGLESGDYTAYYADLLHRLRETLQPTTQA